MITVKRARGYEEFKAGTWFQTVNKDTGERTAWFCCPNGHKGALLDHKVAEDGTVSPSVACMVPNCSFHDNIRLEDWEP